VEINIDKVSEELMNSLSDFQEVLSNGSIAEQPVAVLWERPLCVPKINAPLVYPEKASRRLTSDALT
jgi:hypothetical protein